MRFWDASAVVPLCVRQEASASLKRLLNADSELVVWWGTPVECASALARLRRDAALSTADEETALRALDALSTRWVEVLSARSLRAQASRLVRVHPLRAPDALQLAAALSWRGAGADSTQLVTLDDRLASAALLEGFEVVGTPAP